MLAQTRDAIGVSASMVTFGKTAREIVELNRLTLMGVLEETPLTQILH